MDQVANWEQNRFRIASMGRKHLQLVLELLDVGAKLFDVIGVAHWRNVDDSHSDPFLVL